MPAPSRNSPRRSIGPMPRNAAVLPGDSWGTQMSGFTNVQRVGERFFIDVISFALVTYPRIPVSDTNFAWSAIRRSYMRRNIAQEPPLPIRTGPRPFTPPPRHAPVAPPPLAIPPPAAMPPLARVWPAYVLSGACGCCALCTMKRDQAPPPYFTDDEDDEGDADETREYEDSESEEY